MLRHPDAPPSYDLLDGDEVAKLIGRTRGRVRQLIASGVLPSIKIGRSCYVTRKDALLFLKFGKRRVGRPKGSIQWRLDVLGRRHRIVYPAKNDWAARRAKSRELREEWERAAVEHGLVGDERLARVDRRRPARKPEAGRR